MAGASSPYGGQYGGLASPILEKLGRWDLVIFESISTWLHRNGALNKIVLIKNFLIVLKFEKTLIETLYQKDSKSDHLLRITIPN